MARSPQSPVQHVTLKSTWLFTFKWVTLYIQTLPLNQSVNIPPWSLVKSTLFLEHNYTSSLYKKTSSGGVHGFPLTLYSERTHACWKWRNSQFCLPTSDDWYWNYARGYIIVRHNYGLIRNSDGGAPRLFGNRIKQTLLIWRIVRAENLELRFLKMSGHHSRFFCAPWPRFLSGTFNKSE